MNPSYLSKLLVCHKPSRRGFTGDLLGQKGLHIQLCLLWQRFNLVLQKITWQRFVLFLQNNFNSILLVIWPYLLMYFSVTFQKIIRLKITPMHVNDTMITHHKPAKFQKLDDSSLENKKLIGKYVQTDCNS